MTFLLAYFTISKNVTSHLIPGILAGIYGNVYIVVWGVEKGIFKAFKDDKC